MVVRYGLLLVWCTATMAWAQPDAGRARVRIVPVGEGWARSSVNAVVFRQHSVVTHGRMQYTAYYDAEGAVVLARRERGTREWTVRRTRYTGDVADAHNAISIAVDGSGVLHVAWGLHGQPLVYAQSRQPGGLELTAPLPMTGGDEDAVTYPQFYNLPDGDLLFLYREGRSGNGDVMLNRYDVPTRTWRAVQHPLIDGQGQRNAYVNQLAVDRDGGWHLSWCWRETWDVATNHDIAYAHTPDEGQTWQTSAGQAYTLPITVENAEVVHPISQGSDLINQTSMTVDERGRPLIATYWRPAGSDGPQYHLVWQEDDAWRVSRIGQRTTAFRLSGGGTKRIPLSRPQVLAGRDGAVYVIFRDAERGDGIFVAISTDPDRADWEIRELYAPSVGLWEPTYDPVAWRRDGQLHLFVQRVGQGDGETLEEVPPQPISILEWIP